MPVSAEFFFRPKNLLHRWLARLIGAPTCGVLRGGPEHHKHGDPYDVAVAFCARDHFNTQLEAFPGRSVRPSDIKDAVGVLRGHGLRPWFDRRDRDGQIRHRWGASE